MSGGSSNRRRAKYAKCSGDGKMLQGNSIGDLGKYPGPRRLVPLRAVEFIRRLIPLEL
jgi:hypothetical protein